jgi:carbon-monoxide dehydrogenase medium subunit
LSVEGPGGKRDIPVERFFVGPGRTCLDPTEVLTGISIPVRTPGISSAFLKLGRVSQDIAVVNAAAMVHMEKGVCRQCRLAVGAVAPVPLRLRKVEPMLEGRRVEPGLLEQVSKEVEQEVKPITDVRSTEAYRRVVSGVLIKRAIQRAVERASAGE